jgi:hypothetical protein
MALGGRVLTATERKTAMTSSLLTLKPVGVGPGDTGVDPAYWAKDHSDLMSNLEDEQLKSFEKSLSKTNGDFEELISNANQYGEIIYWLGSALFALIKTNPQVGRNRYVPVRKYIGDVEFEVSQALELIATVLWEKVKKEAQEEYDRQMDTEIPF